MDYLLACHYTPEGNRCHYLNEDNSLSENKSNKVLLLLHSYYVVGGTISDPSRRGGDYQSVGNAPCLSPQVGCILNNSDFRFSLPLIS